RAVGHVDGAAVLAGGGDAEATATAEVDDVAVLPRAEPTERQRGEKARPRRGAVGDEESGAAAVGSEQQRAAAEPVDALRLVADVGAGSRAGGEVQDGR